MVDTVLQFEGDRHYTYRILRTLKNRFGSTAELGIYEMTDTGMRAVKQSPRSSSRRRTAQRHRHLWLPWKAYALLIEGQALVTQSVYGTPQRTVSGGRPSPPTVAAGSAGKRGGFHFRGERCFINIAGGLKAEDPPSTWPS